MALTPLVLQTAGSLVAILALAGIAWWLKLGGAPRLDSADAVARAAGEVEDGFVPADIACDAAGAGALARDAAGRIILIRRHGNRFAGRVLTQAARAAARDQKGEGTIRIDCGEPRFGPTILAIPDAGAWADAINRIGLRNDA